MYYKLYAVTTSALLSLAGAFISPRHSKVALSSKDKIRNANTQPLHESALPFAGSGPRQVDMNQYNLPLEIIEQEWGANVVAKTIDNEGGIFLSCKNLREYFVDQIVVEIPRPASGVGLGIGLQEIAGGREDGLGITVVSDLIEDGYVNSLDVDIMRGDSIAGISIQKSNSKDANGGSVGLTDSKETVSVSTECLGYDGTVDAILSLPDPKTDDETLTLNIRRIRRKPKITVNLKYPPSQDTPDETIELFAGENLRLGMLVRGVKLNDPVRLHLCMFLDMKLGTYLSSTSMCMYSLQKDLIQRVRVIVELEDFAEPA